MKGGGDIEEQAGSYSDWEARGGRLSAITTAPALAPGAEAPQELASHPAGNVTLPKKKTKLSYKDQRELDALPLEIESLEARHRELLEMIAQPDFYEQSPESVAATLTAFTDSEQALDRALERLVELEG
jgi:ATP-binding cassette subfamily F protein uup